MQVLSSLKSAKNRHEDCQIVRRRGRTFVIVSQIHALRLYKAVKRENKLNNPIISLNH